MAGVIFTTLLITVGSLMPKFAAGVSLQELQDTCSREGLPPALRFFNKAHEIWIGASALLQGVVFIQCLCVCMHARQFEQGLLGWSGLGGLAGLGSDPCTPLIRGQTGSGFVFVDP